LKLGTGACFLRVGTTLVLVGFSWACIGGVVCNAPFLGFWGRFALFTTPRVKSSEVFQVSVQIKSVSLAAFLGLGGTLTPGRLKTT